MTKQERRQWAEDTAREAVAATYNLTFGGIKSWEEAYKEALIRSVDSNYSLRQRDFELKTKYNIVYRFAVIQFIVLLGIVVASMLKLI